MLDFSVQFIDLILHTYICFCISFLSACLMFHTLKFWGVEPCPKKLIIYSDRTDDSPILEADTSRLVPQLFVATNNTDLALEKLEKLKSIVS